MAGLLHNITVFMEMIKFSHTIFALPFALSAALLAAQGMPGGKQLLFIVLAMVGARTAAMALNRLIDHAIDAKNPRTAGRALPAGLISRNTVLVAIAISVIVMFWAAAMLNPLCLKLAPVALFFLVLYSYSKRFTSLAHVILGICLAAAPMGAWAALKGTIELPAWVMGLMVLFWVAGFDILYALQDLDFDVKEGLHSIPTALGVNGSLWLARVFHLITLVLLFWLKQLLGLGNWFMVGAIIVALLLLYEHLLLRNGDLTRLDAAFFTMNGYISLTFLGATTLEVLL
ncbi:MAG: UbiA-like polyprenyltransferase [Trichlorobacter sp.]|jgi:4-hydroxybenzoate polyprenyltransferase|nr:UbiA-like polyprenyltransferase [Trichlorobacter sp.]